MNKYRIRIEQFDYDGNLKHQYQAEITDELIHMMKNAHGIDALDESWKQLKHQFFQYIENKNQEQLVIEAIKFVDLPSKGLFYDQTNPLSKGVVEMKCMTDHECNLYELSRRDVEQIIRTCENPPEPNDDLKNAVKNYKKLNQWIKEKLKSVYIKF